MKFWEIYFVVESCFLVLIPLIWIIKKLSYLSLPVFLFLHRYNLCSLPNKGQLRIF